MVAIGVVEHTPPDLLKAWIAVETFARNGAEAWPGNAALARRMGLKVRAMQYALDQLEDHGVIVRRRLPGNRRSIVMARRTASELTALEWSAMAARAGALAAGRKALAAERKAARKRHAPKIRLIG